MAAGRQILQSHAFPILDTFSYTFYGRPWINQNWLSHVLFWWLYDAWGPDAVIIGTWILGVATFGLSALAVWFRCGSWTAAAMAAAVVAFACRDWLSARPATVQFFCLASLTMALSALLRATPSTKRAWWPLLVVLAAFAVWPHAHGSFVLGFGLAAVLVGCWAVARVVRRGALTPDRLIAGLIIISLVTGAAGAIVSPFGIGNYIHPSHIAGSSVFRSVGEWAPPYVRGPLFPPATRFWVALAVAFAALTGAIVLRVRLRPSTPAASMAVPPRHLQLLLFDLAVVAISLGLALFARRFAPIFHILAAPVVTSWVLRVPGAFPPPLLRRVRIATGVTAGMAAVTLAVFTARLAWTELWPPHVSSRGNLLDRVTQTDLSARPAFEFLRRNDLRLNVWTEWRQAGPLLFEVPGTRVFIDGRAQQLYSEDHYRLYLWMLKAKPSDSELLARHLAASGTEAVLLPKYRTTWALVTGMHALPDWIDVLETRHAIVWVARDGPVLEALGRRERAGELWWPDNPEALVNRGLLWVATAPPEPEQAEALWRAALARDLRLGVRVYPRIIRALQQQGRTPEAAAFVRTQRQQLQQVRDTLASDDWRALTAALDHCETLLAP